MWADLSKALPATRVPSRALYTPSARTESPAMSVVRRSVSVRSAAAPAPRFLHEPPDECTIHTGFAAGAQTPHASQLGMSQRWHSRQKAHPWQVEVLSGGEGGGLVDTRGLPRERCISRWQGPHLKVVLIASTTFLRSSSRRSVSARRLMSSFSRASFARPSASDSAFSRCTFFSSSACAHMKRLETQRT